MANTAASLPGFDMILNNNESSKIYFSARTLIFLIVDLLLGNLFWARYKYISLK